jgi:hypothetical protein
METVRSERKIDPKAVELGESIDHAVVLIGNKYFNSLFQINAKS